jgi:hypothetical protein
VNRRISLANKAQAPTALAVAVTTVGGTLALGLLSRLISGGMLLTSGLGGLADGQLGTVGLGPRSLLPVIAATGVQDGP